MKNKLPCSNKQLNKMCLKLYFGWYYTITPGWIIYQSLCLPKSSLNYNGISNEVFLTWRETNELNIGGNFKLLSRYFTNLLRVGLTGGEKFHLPTNTLPKYLIYFGNIYFSLNYY